MKAFSFLTAAIVSLGALTVSQAATISSSTTGISSPAQVITFDGGLYAANTTITNQFQNLSFSGSPVFYDGNGPSPGGCNFNQIGVDCLANFTTVNGVPGSASGTNYSIFFNSVQTAVAFAFVSPTTSGFTFTALLNGAVQSSFSPATGINSPGPGNYYGFSGINSGFNQIQITAPSSALFVLDNVQLSQAPEPGTIGMFAFGLSGLVYAVRRNRAK